MTARQPDSYELYPPRPEEAAVPDGPDPGAVVPAPEPEPPSRGFTRRGGLRLLAGTAAVGALGAVLWLGDPYPPPSYVKDQVAAVTVRVGNYAMGVPAGWTVQTAGSEQAVVTNDANRIFVRTFDTTDDPAEVLPRLAETGGEGFVGGSPDVVAYTRSGVQKASITDAGTFAGRPGTMTARLWVDADGSALLVVVVRTAAEGTPTSDEAAAMVTELTYGLP